MNKKWFTVKQLDQNVFGIGEFNHFEKVISYLIVGKERALLFDTGMGIGDIRREVKTITQLQLIVIHSHTHYDHVGGDSQFSNEITRISNKKTINLSPYSFRIIHTPGHSPDSICLYEKTHGYLFCGDTLYNGPLYLHLPESSLTDFKKSLTKLSNLNNVKRIFPGHNEFSFNLKLINILQEVLANKNMLQKKEVKISDKLSVVLPPTYSF